LVVNANVVPISIISDTLMMEAIDTSETSILTRTTRRQIPEDGIFELFRDLFVGPLNITHIFQTVCEAHPTSYRVGTAIYFHVVSAAGG
jgi:hypothetical protein